MTLGTRVRWERYGDDGKRSERTGVVVGVQPVSGKLLVKSDASGNVVAMNAYELEAIRKEGES